MGVATPYSTQWSQGEIFSSTALVDRVEVVRGATGLRIEKEIGPMLKFIVNNIHEAFA